MLSQHNWNNVPATMGELAVGSVESTRYAQGLNVLRRLHKILDNILDTPSKAFRQTPLTVQMVFDSLKKGMTQTEWENWVIGLALKENQFMKIGGKTKGDFDDILEDIADLAPTSGLVTRSMVDAKFLDPKYFQQSIAEKAYTAAKVTVQSARAVANKAVEVGNFAVNAKWFLLAGGLGLLAYKLIGQSDKVALAYNTLKNDSKAGLSSLKEQSKKGYAHFKKELSEGVEKYKASKVKTNPRRKYKASKANNKYKRR